ncbi:MAG: hypothetical protein WCO25_03790 [Candidatus Uhrbacteria bacterium]
MEDQIEDQEAKDMMLQIIRKVEELQREVAGQSKQLDEIETHVLRDGSKASLTNMKILCMEHKINKLHDDRFGSMLDNQKKEYLQSLKN